MLALLSLLQSRRDWPGGVLAERLEVSARTVRRDVDRLRELGYRIGAAKGPDGGYRLEPGSDLPPLLFDDEQAVVLAVALQTVSLTGSDFVDAAERTLATVRQVLPSRLRRQVDAVQVTAVSGRTAREPVENPADATVLLGLSAAVRDREVVRFDYANATSGNDAVDGPATMVPPRRAEPHHLITRNGHWYLIGWDLDRVDWRTFRVDRMSLRSGPGPRFTPRALPGGDPAAFVNARFRGADPRLGGQWPCVGEVVLHRPAGELVPFVHDGTVESVDAERCRISLGAWSWTGLGARIGAFEADIEEAGPHELREAFAALGRRFAAAGSAVVRDSAG